MAIKTIRPGQRVRASRTTKVTASGPSKTRELMQRTRWSAIRTPNVLAQFFKKHTGLQVVNVRVGADAASKGCLSVSLGKLGEAVAVWFAYFPKTPKESGFIVEPLPTLTGYLSIVGDASKSVSAGTANLMDLGPMVQIERALKFLSGATSEIEKVSIKLLGVTPTVLGGMAKLSEQMHSENEKVEADTKFVEERYMKARRAPRP